MDPSGEAMNMSNNVENTNSGTNSPTINADPFVNRSAMDAVIVHEMPTGEPVSLVGYEEKSTVHKYQEDETIPNQYPVVETAADEPQVIKDEPYKAPINEPVIQETPAGVSAGSLAPLFNHEESEHFRTRWNEIQGKFVDEPRSAVQAADVLVSEVVEKITQMFTSEHSSLESQWNQGSDVSTENLRQALQHYRSFFNRLVV
jgi:hypothetical protein